MKNVAPSPNTMSADMGVYLQPAVQGVNYHCEFNLFFDRSSAGGAAAAAALLESASPRLAGELLLLPSLWPLGRHGVQQGSGDGRRSPEGQEDL